MSGVPTDTQTLDHQVVASDMQQVVTTQEAVTHSQHAHVQHTQHAQMHEHQQHDLHHQQHEHHQQHAHQQQHEHQQHQQHQQHEHQQHEQHQQAAHPDSMDTSEIDATQIESSQSGQMTQMDHTDHIQATQMDHSEMETTQEDQVQPLPSNPQHMDAVHTLDPNTGVQQVTSASEGVPEPPPHSALLTATGQPIAGFEPSHLQQFGQAQVPPAPGTGTQGPTVYGVDANGKQKPIPARVLAVVVNNPLNESKPPPPPPLPIPGQVGADRSFTQIPQISPLSQQSDLTKPLPQPSGHMSVSIPVTSTAGAMAPGPANSYASVPMHMSLSPVRAWTGPSPPPPPPLPRNLDCHICGYKAPYPSKLRVHIDHHLKNRRFRCQKCPKAYVTKSELRRHMKRLNHSDVPIAGYNRRNRRTFDARATGWTCAVCDSDRVVAPGGRGSKLPNALQGDLHPRRIVIEGEEPKSVCNACYVHYHRYKTLRPKPVASARSTPNQRKPARVSEEMKEREACLRLLCLREQHGDKDWLFKCKCARRCVALFLTQKNEAGQWECSEQKVKEIMDVHKVADQLSKEKYVTVDHEGKPLRPGPGGGQRKSPTFTAHVLNSRAIYSDLCEIAKQHILVYSNGFLHYKPVNGVPRVEIKRREYKIGVEHLSTYQCCRRKCLEGIRAEYVTKKRQEYEVASQEGRNRLVQLVIEGDGRGPYRCVKSIKALLGCGEHVISAAFRTVMQDKVAGIHSAPHRNRGRSPANRTPPEVEEKFKEHLFNVTTAHARDPQIRILKRSCDSNKKLRKSFNEIHEFDISESTLRNVQKRVMAQNGIKRVERPEGSEGIRSSVATLIHPFGLQPSPTSAMQGIPPAPIQATQVPQGVPVSAIVTSLPDESTRVTKRQKLEKSSGSDGSGDDDEEEHEVSTPPPPPPPGAPPPGAVDPSHAPAMMIHPPPPPGMYGQLTPYHPPFGQFPMHFPQHFFPPMVQHVPGIQLPMQQQGPVATGVGVDGEVQKTEENEAPVDDETKVI